MNATIRQQLQELRHSLLALHKALVEEGRVSYEKTFGPIPSPSHFLKLLTGDPWFAWLQPLSQLIVAMDEALDAKEPVPDTDVAALLNQARTMLAPSETGEGFAKHYHDALQSDPDVVLAHASAARLLGPRPKPA